MKDIEEVKDMKEVLEMNNNGKRKNDACPYILKYVGERVPCSFPKKTKCGFGLMKNKVETCRYRIKDLGKEIAIKEAMELLTK